MRRSFVIMLVIGLGLMGLFWYQTWVSEDAKIKAMAPITGCATTPNCPEKLDRCLTAYGQHKGVCSSPCAADSQCPEDWCCPPQLEGMKERLCLPRQACLRLKRP